MTVGLLLLRSEIIQSSAVKISGLLLPEETQDCYLLLVKTLPKKHTLAAPEFSQQKEDCYFNPQEFGLGGRDCLNPLFLPTKVSKEGQRWIYYIIIKISNTLTFNL